MSTGYTNFMPEECLMTYETFCRLGESTKFAKPVAIFGDLKLDGYARTCEPPAKFSPVARYGITDGTSFLRVYFANYDGVPRLIHAERFQEDDVSALLAVVGMALCEDDVAFNEMPRLLGWETDGDTHAKCGDPAKTMTLSELEAQIDALNDAISQNWLAVDCLRQIFRIASLCDVPLDDADVKADRSNRTFVGKDGVAHDSVLTFVDAVVLAGLPTLDFSVVVQHEPESGGNGSLSSRMVKARAAAEAIAKGNDGEWPVEEHWDVKFPRSGSCRLQLDCDTDNGAPEDELIYTNISAKHIG